MGNLVRCWWTCVMITAVSLVVYFVFLNGVNTDQTKNVKGNIFCYYIGSNAVRVAAPEELDPHLCTHIAYAFVSMTANGTLVPQNEKLDIKNGVYKRVTALKKLNPSLKVLLSIGSVNADVFSTVAASEESRMNLARSSKLFLETYNFDGIDVDWEKPYAKDKDNFLYLLRDLKKELKKNNWILTAAVYPIPSVGYNVPEILRYIDILNLMTYNFYGPWSSYTGQNSPLYASSIESTYEKKYLNANASVHHWIDAGAPPEKINLGIAFYGRSYKLLNETNRGLHAPFDKKDTKTYTFRQICVRFSNWTRVWDDEQKNPYIFNGDNWISYDDEESVKEKAKYVVSNGLGGSMIWHIGGDDVSGDCGPKQKLLRVIHHEMNKKR